MDNRINSDKVLAELSRIIVGGTSLFSGFVKAVDPLGFTYKIEDYLIEMNLVELFPLALTVAVIMVVAEFMLGALLLLGVYRKPVTLLLALFMIIFTPFTLWVALTNPVEDCGCFGDALVISNWQTFYKNLILLVGALLLVVKWKFISPLYSSRFSIYVSLFVALFGVLFALHNVYKLPVLDFRPYKIGSNIPKQMYIDPDKADVLETVFIYSKDGVEKEFTEEDYPWDDPTWTFIDMETRVVVEGEKPAIEDFAMVTLNGADITDQVLSDSGYTFLMVSYSLENMNLKYIEKFKKVNEFAENNNYSFYLITSSSSDKVEEWEEIHSTGIHFTHADERALKTMIRANPGLILIKNGNVINKWDDSKVPEPTNDMLHERNPKRDNVAKLLLVTLLFFVPLIILNKIDRRLISL